MQRLDKRAIVGAVFLVVGVMALIGGLDSHSAQAADPDRHVFESDRYHTDFDSDELEAMLEEVLGSLESLEHLEGLEDFGLHMEGFAEELAEHIEDAMEHGAIRIDRDWPDTVWLRDNHHDLRFDTRHLARQMERMARNIQRDVVRGLERDALRGERRVRAWKIDEERMDRDDIEFELRELQREMRRLERQLEELDVEGDI